MAYPSLTYRGTSTLTTDTAVYTFTGCAIGTPSELRAVLVFVQFSSLSGNWPDGTNPASLTINGVEATRLSSIQVFFNGHIAAYIAYVPTGSTCDIVVTYNLTGTRCSIVWYTLKPSSLTPVDVVTIAGQNVTDDSLLDIATVNNGAVVICWVQNGSGAQTLTWTGPDSITTDLALTNIDAGGYWLQSINIKPTETSTTRDLLMSSAQMRRNAIAISLNVEATNFGVTTTEGLGIGEAPVRALRMATTSADAVQLFEVPRYTPITQYTDTLAEALGVSEVTVVPLLTELVEDFGLAELVTPGAAVYATDALDVRDAPPVPSYALTLTDTVGNHETLSYQYVHRPVVAERVGVKDTPAPAMHYVAGVIDRGGIRETVLVGVPRSITEGIGIHDAVKAIRSVVVLERLGLASLLLPRTSFGTTISDRPRITDVVRRFFGGDVLEGIGVSESLAKSPRLPRTVTEGIGVNDTLAKKLVLRITSQNDLSIDDNQVLKMLFKPVLDDGVEFAAAYVAPNGNITTWAINTKNFATTEYTNFEFNSFAQMGRKYIAASSNGLYELDGDTDNGAAIIADIKSGLMQLGGSRFSSFKAAYLGMRGTGDFVLKLETGDGKTYNYAVIGKDMQTTKVHFGKGLRARYFAFELISTGQDFDIDSVEFIPLVAQRRV